MTQQQQQDLQQSSPSYLPVQSTTSENKDSLSIFDMQAEGGIEKEFGTTVMPSWKESGEFTFDILPDNSIKGSGTITVDFNQPPVTPHLENELCNPEISMRGKMLLLPWKEVMIKPRIRLF